VIDRRLARISCMRAPHLPALAGACAVLALAAGSQAAAGEGAARIQAASGAGAAPTAAANRASADRDVRALLGRVVLPPGARALSGRPPGAGAIDNAQPQQATPDIADVHAWWRAPGTLDSVVAFEKAHAPAGSSFAGSGGGSTPGTTGGGTTPGTTGGGTTPGTTGESSSAAWSYVEFSFPARAGVLGSRMLIVKVSALGAHATALRVDAEDVWVIPRSPGERIPAGVGEVDVSSANPGRPPSLTRSVTDASQVRTIVTLIDALPIVQPGAIACPMIMINGPTVTFTFRASAGGKILAQASQYAAFPGPNTACDPMRLSIEGRTQTPLLGGNGFVAAVGKLLGLKLGAAV